MNICLVVIDSLRPDHLSCYGYTKRTSVNIDAIAKDSLVFKNAISQSNWTYASLYSLISGRYPSTHSVSWFDQRINESFITLPELLQSSGYQTAIFSSFKTLINRSGFGRHFNETRYMEIDTDILESLTNWLKNNQPLFLIFHIGDYVHEPYYADKKYVDMFYEEGDKGLNIDDTVNYITSISSRGFGDRMREVNRKLNLHIKRLSKKQLAYIIACYDAGIYYVDRFVGRFYEIVQRELKDYLFILTADHGQCFFEHGFYGHGLHLYDEAIKVPLIMDIKKENKGRVEEPTQLIDIYPTVVEILGLKNKINNLDGISLVPFFSQKDLGLNNRFAISESPPFITIRNGVYKLITTYFRLMQNNLPLRELYLNCKNKNIRRLVLNLYALLSSDKLYNTLEDSKEQNNIIRQEKTVYKLLFKELKEVLKNAQTNGRQPLALSIDDEIKQQLKSLGYM